MQLLRSPLDGTRGHPNGLADEEKRSEGRWLHLPIGSELWYFGARSPSEEYTPMARSRSKHQRMKSRRRQQWKARTQRRKTAAKKKTAEKPVTKRAASSR